MILLYTIIPSNYLRIVGGDRESTAERGSVPSRSTGVRGGCVREYGGNTGKKSTTPRVVVTPRREGNGARVPTPCENR